MTSLPTGALIAALILIALGIAGLILQEVRIRRRVKRAPLELVRRRIDEVAAMPAPDELPRSRDVTKAERRRMTIPQRRPRKRRTGSWG